MHLNRRQSLALVAGASVLPLAGRAAGDAPGDAPDEATIEAAYLYLLARALVLRQERADMAAPGAAYNVIRYNPLGSADFVNPNFDVAYLEAWFAVDARTPVILEVPEITGRYYTAQILDEWGEVIVNINERTFPSKPFGRFALVPPGWTGALPAGVTPIALRSGKAKMLGRVELKGDPDGAVALQKAFRAAPLGTPVIAASPWLPDFTNQDLIGAAIFDDLEARLASAPDVSPVAAETQQRARAVAAHVASSDAARAAVEQLLRDKVIPAFIDYAFTRSAPYRDHWIGGGAAGTYGADYRLRSVIAYAGIWANTPAEVLYFVATRDAEEAPLDGASSYVIHFPADQLPDSVVDAYWSIILVGVPDYRVVPNDLKRYNLNSYSALRKEADGSLRIAIGPAPVPGVPEENWLPSAAGEPFSLTLRTYVPKAVVREGRWSPPAVTRAG